ncbi:MAG TPA: efflux RND transporter periplasmic adaptor subunit [Anaeromyxobacteraceae bacterium]|nr:efflux RND transporter periplasmic adaptor subunit [Anaeromyxobacteraceae bacterium]
MSEGRSRIFLVLAAVAVALVLLGALVLLRRRADFRALAADTEAQAIATVAVIHPLADAAGEELVLPGSLQAFVESPIYARASGYLRRWYHDIGARVQRGDPLADIEAPEVDQQLASARADLAAAQATRRVAELTATRYGELLADNGVSRQEAENAAGDLAAKTAAVHSLEANVKRLEQLKGFQRVTSPFSGVVTRRNVDPGTLVNAGNGGASQVLFVVAQTDPIRVFVNVPEAQAAAVRPGLAARLGVTQFPGEAFRGEVVRTAGAIDPATHAMLAEIDVPNAAGKLLPGGYARVHLSALPAQGQRVRLPLNALLFRAEGLRAAVVDQDDRIRLQAVAVGRDHGTYLEIVTGLDPADRVVLNPPDGIAAGQRVRVREVASPVAPPAADARRPAAADARP